VWLTMLPDMLGVPSRKFQVKVYGAVPPLAVALNVREVPAIPVEGPPIVTLSGSGLMFTFALADAVLLAASVAVTVMVRVPFVLNVVVKLLPVPLDGDPPGALQLKEMGWVPPVALAVHVIGVPTVPVVGQLIVTTRFCALTRTTWLVVAVLAFASVTVNVTV